MRLIPKMANPYDKAKEGYYGQNETLNIEGKLSTFTIVSLWKFTVMPFCLCNAMDYE